MKNRGRLAKQATLRRALVWRTLLIGILALVWLSAPISMRAAAATTVTPSAQPISSVSRAQVILINDIVETNQNDLAGLGIDPDHTTATVYVVAARQALASTAVTVSAIQAVASKPAPDGDKNWTLAFALATYSLTELRQARDAVTVREPWATASRPYLAEWYLDAISNKIVLGVTEISSTLTAAAQQTFGDMARLIVAARIGAADRKTDYSPWTAGDAITIGFNGCTSGFSAYDTVTLAHGELGAGHCSSAEGDLVQQSTATMGHVAYRVFGGGSIDFAFVNSSADGSDSSPSVFTTLSSLTSVSSSLTSGGIFGYPVCTSGSVTLENCALTVRLEDVCKTYTSGEQVCHLDMAESTNGSEVTNHGDSGGPVYHKNPGGDVQAVGVINACTAVSPTNPQCITPSTQVWFTPIRFIPSRFHVMTTTVPTCTSVTVSAAPPSPTGAGTQVTITGSASGCSNPGYEFWARWQGYTTWQLLQGYSTSNVYVWNSTGAAPGTEYLGVWAKDAGSSTSTFDAHASIPYTVTTPSCASVTISAVPTSVVYGSGMHVTITGAASGCPNPNPLYEFWLRTDTTGWQLIQAYSTSGTYDWNSTGAPVTTVYFGVWAKDASSTTTTFDANTYTTVTVA